MRRQAARACAVGLAAVHVLASAGCGSAQPPEGPASGTSARAPAGGETRSGRPAPAVTLELIMRDPDWMGRFPERPYWSDDGVAFYYSQRREDDEKTGSGRDLIRVEIATGESRVIPDSDLG